MSGPWTIRKGPGYNQPDCDHHDAPLICGQCTEDKWAHGHDPNTPAYHPFRPVHRIVECGVCGDQGWQSSQPDIEWFHATRGKDYIGRQDHPFQSVERDVPCGLT